MRSFFVWLAMLIGTIVSIIGGAYILARPVALHPPILDAAIAIMAFIFFIVGVALLPHICSGIKADLMKSEKQP